MRVILTDRFKNEYLKLFLKYFTKENLVKHLKERNHTFISLHYPFVKLKNKINTLALRGVILIIKDNTIVPLMMFTKKDKRY
jgi:hypothetical protein